MDNKPHEHHFIPVFYLKQWRSSTTKKLIEYSIKHGKVIPRSVGPKRTGFQDHLYSFPELPPDVAEHVEDVFLRKSDNDAALAHQRLLAWDKSEWPTEMILAWSRCVMHLHLRHPDTISEMRVAAKAIWDSTGAEIQKQYEEARQPGDPATLDEYLTRSDPHAIGKLRMNMIIRAIDLEDFGRRIASMIWQVSDVTKSAKTLLTSDRPVLIHKPRQPDGWITLPISPTKVFIGANSQATLDNLSRRSITAVVEELNERVVTRARRYVYARDPWQEDYIRRNMGTRKEPTPIFPRLADLSRTD